ncbi:MAG: hypothetical protein M3O15_15455 [Acidobacteriota bacterium]|nr:hypothetical protein [Acidobacteriota bacterium]
MGIINGGAWHQDTTTGLNVWDFVFFHDPEGGPDQQIYVPKPYPKTDREVILDYLFQYKSLHRERADPKTLPDNELPLLYGILRSTVTFTVQRVENWLPMRCTKDQRRDFFYLIRVLDAGSGSELARVALNPTGLWSVQTNAASAAVKTGGQAAALLDRLPDPEAAFREVVASYKIQGGSPQYVTTTGTIYCFRTNPCLAFRQGSDAFILYKGALFQISGSGPRLADGKDVGTLETSARVLQSLRNDERLVSLGGSAWTLAQEVKGGASPPQHR